VSELRRKLQFERLHPRKSLLILVVKAFSRGILKTAFDRWFDGTVLVLPLVIQLLRRSWSSVWDLAGPSLIFLCFLVAIHLVNAVKGVWVELRTASVADEVESPIYTAEDRKKTYMVSEPAPACFRARLY